MTDDTCDIFLKRHIYALQVTCLRKRIRDARYTRQKNIAQAFILERYFFVSICPAVTPDTCLSVFLAAVLLLC